MLRKDVENEIGRLKAKRAEISSRINSTRNFDTKEELKKVLVQIDSQIKFLERMSSKQD